MSLLSFKKPTWLVVILGLLVLFSAVAITQKPKTFFPILELEVLDPSGKLALFFIFEGRPSLESCETILGNVARKTMMNCPACIARQVRCEQQLDPAHILLLTDQPLDVFSGKMPNGVVTYTSNNPAFAQAACSASEVHSVKQGISFKCFQPGSTRWVSGHKSGGNLGLQSWIILGVSALVSWLSVWLILRYEHLHAHISHDHVDSGPQKYHEFPTPRIGGVALMMGLLAALSILLVMAFAPGVNDVFALHDVRFVALSFGLLLLSSMPAFLGGLVEDITKRVGVSERLFLTMLAGSLAAWLLGAVLPYLHVPGLDDALSWYPFAIVFTVFAVGGIANALNIIDGYNGLAGGFSIIILVGMAATGFMVGDAFIVVMSLALTGALLGFMFWNWPGGSIFLGDGGAYLTGFLLAELSVLLVVRNPEVSPWFPLALLIYPVFETFYSIYRRKFGEGVSPGQPDNQHLHQLIHDNLVPSRTRHGIALSQLQMNSRVAKYFWGPAAVMVIFSTAFYNATNILVLAVIAFCVFYVANYLRIARTRSNA